MTDKKSAAQWYWRLWAEAYNEEAKRQGLQKIPLPGMHVTLGDLLKPGVVTMLAEFMPALELASKQIAVYEAIINSLDPKAKKIDAQAVSNKLSAMMPRSKPWQDLLDAILAEPTEQERSAKERWRRVVANPYPKIAVIGQVGEATITWTDPTTGRTGRPIKYRSFASLISQRVKEIQRSAATSSK